MSKPQAETPPSMNKTYQYQYQYQCLDCNVFLNLGEFSSKSALKVLYQAISNGQNLAEIKDARPKVWQLLFKDAHPLLNFLTEHSYYHGNHQVCAITPEGQIFDASGREICPDCKDSLDSIYYSPPFDPCHQKHVEYALNTKLSNEEA